MLQSRAMKVIAVTGGIASGKSTVVQLLTELGGKGVEVFDCDAVTRRLRDGCEDPRCDVGMRRGCIRVRPPVFPK